MSTQAAVLQLHQREAFERNVTRALAVGAGTGVLAVLSERLGARVPLEYLALAGTSLACVRGDKMDRILLSALSVTLTALPWAFGLTHGWTVALAAACAGAIMVRARVCERGDEGSVGAGRPGWVHYALGALGCAGLAVAGLEVANIIGLRLADVATPPILGGVIRGLIVSLFVAIGSIAGHLALRPDPVEARCEELIPQLSGELHQLASRALGLYRQCGHSLASLPREPAREELAKTLSKMTKDAVELAADWTGVESQLEDADNKNLAQEVAELSKSAAAAKDPVARRQLELAAQSLGEELERLNELKLRRERIIAKLKANVALLERAKVALIGMRSGHTQMKAAELSALARKFSALAQAQGDEGRLIDAVATNAELGHQEADAELRKSSLAAVVPVTSTDASDDAPAEAAKGDERV